MHVVEEQGRALAEQLPPGYPWSYREQLATSRMHQGAEAAAAVVMRAHSDAGVLLCDGSPATPAVWHICAMRSRSGYDGGDPDVTRELLDAAAQPYDLVLLLAPDLPWEPDGVREDPEGRDDAFEEYRRLYPDAAIISGSDRIEPAIRLVEKALADPGRASTV